MTSDQKTPDEVPPVWTPLAHDDTGGLEKAGRGPLSGEVRLGSVGSPKVEDGTPPPTDHQKPIYPDRRLTAPGPRPQWVSLGGTWSGATYRSVRRGSARHPRGTRRTGSGNKKYGKTPLTRGGGVVQREGGSSLRRPVPPFVSPTRRRLATGEVCNHRSRVLPQPPTLHSLDKVLVHRL